MNEVWKDIKGYENLYQISNFGRVKSLDRYDATGHHWEEKIIKPRIDKDFYCEHVLCKTSKKRVFRTHRLVAEAFLPNPENKPCIDHINTIRDDNRVFLNEDGSVNYEKTNLRWCTNKENHNNPLSVINHSKATSKPVLQFTQDGSFIKKWNSATEVNKKINIASTNISMCCKGNTHCKSAGGFIWKYYQGFFLGDLAYTVRNRVDS